MTMRMTVYDRGEKLALAFGEYFVASFLRRARARAAASRQRSPFAARNRPNYELFRFKYEHQNKPIFRGRSFLELSR